MNYPNIIFIVLDTLRVDRVLATYKNKNLTPYIKSLLKNSIYFENCIANSPWTFLDINLVGIEEGIKKTYDWLKKRNI